MKPASSALITYLNDARANPDVPLFMADIFTFTLLSGLAPLLHQCRRDRSATTATPISRNSILVDGLKYKASVGLEVDQQQITVAARVDRHDHRRRAVPAGAARRLFRRLRNRARPQSFFSDRHRRHRDRLRDCCSRAGLALSTRSDGPAPSLRSIPIWCCSTSTCRATSISRPACTRSTIPAARW